MGPVRPGDTKGAMILCFTIATLFVALWVYRHGWVMYNDSATYLLISAGHPASGPFRWRLLIPWILRPWVRKSGPPPYRPKTPAHVHKWVARPPMFIWSALSWACMITTAVLLSSQTVTPWMACILFCAIPWYRILAAGPFMTDQLGMLCAVAVTLLPLEFAIPVAIIGGLAHERSPVFAAAYAWNPIFLVGCIPPLLIALFKRTGRGPCLPWEMGWVDKWFSGTRSYHNGCPLWYLIAPWGAMLLGAEPDIQLGLVVALAYGQMVVACDRERLFQWAAPALLAPAVAVLSGCSNIVITLVLTAHIFSPFMDPVSAGKKVWGDSDG